MKVGDKLYRKKDGDVKEEIINRVGNKYYYLNGLDIKVDKRDLMYRHEYAGNLNVKFYDNPECIDHKEIEEKEKRELTSTIRHSIGTYGSNNLSLEQLRAIHKIITN